MKSTDNNSVVIYRDITFFLVFIPVVNALNYYLTYNNISFTWHTALTFIIDTLQGYAAWLVIRAIIIYLDKKISYHPNPLKRIFIQIMVTSVAGLAVIVITTEILNAIATDKPVPGSFYRLDIFIFLIWCFVINGIYIGWHYYMLWSESEKLRKEEKKIRQSGFIVRQGKQSLTIPLEDVSAFYVESDYAILLTSVFKKHLLDQSLEKIEKQLPEELFFRINRQHILHRKIITGFERGDNGKINVIIADTGNLPKVIQMSRTKASAFKTWFGLEE